MAEGSALEEKLITYDLAICKAFAYKVKTQTTDRAWPMTYQAFPQDPPLPPLDQLHAHVAFLAGLKLELYDCCLNSCLAYTGPHDVMQSCPHCKELQFHADGKPQKRFTYLPITPHLCMFAENAQLA
jgi:hypothetical protein